MRFPKEILVLFLTFYLGEWSHVRANTEIVNFVPSPGADILLSQTLAWDELSPISPEKLFRVLPAPLGTAIAEACGPVTETSLAACPHELWFSVNADDPAWIPYSKFTLRVSWPASDPADFFIDTYSPESLAQLLYGKDYVEMRSSSTSTRRTYARIRLISTGVLTPTWSHTTLEPVAFMVAVEPLLFGVLSTSVIPTILFLVAVAILAGVIVVPFATKHLSAIASQVKAEMSGQDDRKSQ